jgi:signal transduction histidine kinase/DNA-binding response OmpR family regulator
MHYSFGLNVINLPLKAKNKYLWGFQAKSDFTLMEENRILIRLRAKRLIIGLYLFILLFAIVAYFVMNDLENDGIVRDTQLERGIVTLLFIAIWTFACYRLLRNNMQIFDGRSQVFDTRESDFRNMQDAVRLREQFMANMSHEIRTPLNAIIGFSSLLQHSNLGERERELSYNILISSENLLNIVNDILDFSKIEAGMLVLESVSFDPNGLIYSVQQMFIEKAHQKKLSLEIKIAPEVPEQLKGDSTRLTQILVNLIGNAVKFTEKGGIIINVTTFNSHLLKNNNSIENSFGLRFEVKDSGIGIAKNKIDRVFDRFTQSDEQTTRIYGGTGLGLSIVKQLVELMQGNITLQSELGKGSTFIIELPFLLPEEKSANSNEKIAYSNENKPLLPANSLHNEDFTILVAEDNLMNRRVIELLFESWNFKFKMVKNGLEAVEIIEKNSSEFQLVLMDIQMPEMDGYEATKKIRQKSKVPIVAMTAHALAGEREKCLTLGMNDYISKPIRESELHELILRFSNKKAHKTLVIDREYLKETTLGNPLFQKELATIFLTQTPIDLENISIALKNADLNNAAKVAHNMKSTVGYMGFANNIGADLTFFEQDCMRGNDLANLQNSLVNIKANVDLARELVEKEF